MAAVRAEGRPLAAFSSTLTTVTDMTPASRILPTILLAIFWTSAAFGESALQGDHERGAAVYRLNCAACHGAERRGDGPLAASLRKPAPRSLADPAFLMQRSDGDLHKAIAEGGAAVGASPLMPAFGERMAELDAWDAVAFLRDEQLAVDDFFPEAARFTAKEYKLDADSLKRLAPVLGTLPEDETRVTVVAVFGGKKSAEGPVFVPQDPRFLDSLKPKHKLGYVAFTSLAFPALDKPLALAIALDRDGKISALRPDLTGVDAKGRERIERLLAGFVGLGGKQAQYAELKVAKPSPKDAKQSAELAKTLTRAYFRTLEGAVMYDKEERERHWAD
jgi:mono/diheme cytochrome c family protein